MNTEQLRAEFEAWCASREYDFMKRLDGTGYNNMKTYRAWEAWKAKAALQSQDREDAERYRWLRDGGNDDMGVVRGFDCIDCGSTAVAATYEEGLEGGQLDAAIDHARKEQQP